MADYMEENCVGQGIFPKMVQKNFMCEYTLMCTFLAKTERDPSKGKKECDMGMEYEPIIQPCEPSTRAWCTLI